MQPFTVIEINANGTTTPQIEDDIEVLLIQDGEVTVGKLSYDTENDFSSLAIDSPLNEDELYKEANALIKKMYPHYLDTLTSVVLVAPIELAEKMEW
ncbi:MAG: hypothetical protein P4L41_01390 [Flavipsychrobacter sp.]|nr:hypothetical protein [Flavipsychrobacter sp.]